MLLGAESYDYLDPPASPISGSNDAQLTALGYYQIISGLAASTNTRFNYGNSLRFAGVNNDSTATWLLPNNPQPDTVFAGMAFYVDEVNENDHPYFALWCSQQNQAAVTVTFMPYGIIRVSVGNVDNEGNPAGDVIYLSPGGTYRLNTWFYIEIGLHVDPATMTPAGTMELRFNTVAIADYIDVTTAPIGVTFVDSIQWRLGVFPAGGQKLVYWDDVYVCDNVPSAEGPPNDTFLGNVRVQGLLVSGPGDSTDFDKFGAATNWQAARNQAVDDTSYVFSSTPGDFDLYTIDPIINTPNVFAVQVKGAYRQDDATQRFAANVLKSSGTLVEGTPHAVNGNYSFQWDIYSADPHTNLTWLYADVNNVQIGPKVDS